MLGRLAARYGRRGAFLIITGAAWFAFGLSVFLAPPESPRSWVLHDQIPTWLEGVAWFASGAVAVWQGLRGPARHDWLGHVALYVMPAVRVISFTIAWLLWVASTALVAAGITAHTIGWSGGWYAALVWSLISLMLRLVAEWPNPIAAIPAPPAHAAEESRRG